MGQQSNSPFSFNARQSASIRLLQRIALSNRNMWQNYYRQQL